MVIERVLEQNEAALNDQTGFLEYFNAPVEARQQVVRYHDFFKRCFFQEIAAIGLVIAAFALTYLGCWLADIEYGTFLHGKVLYTVFVVCNIYAAGQCFFSWAVLNHKSVARDYMFFWAVAFTGAAVGNSIDFAIWAGEIGPFKQNMLTNLIFVFSLILSFPGMHFLAQVCQVKITKQPVLYFLPLAVTYAVIPTSMNYAVLHGILEAGTIVDIGHIPYIKEFLFGIFYALVVSYLSSLSLFIWQTGKGRLVHSTRLIAAGTVIFSFGCAIYAGLFPTVPLLRIPGNPSHILIALGYVIVALGLRRTEKTIEFLMNPESEKLPPVTTLIEIFGENEGFAVYKRLENNIRATLLELSKSREETQLKQEEIGQLEQEIHLRKKTENELLIAKERAEEASRAKSEFLAMISHELKTPLTVIRGYSALLKNKTLEKLIESQKIAGIAGEIEKNSGLLEKMLNDLLEFSRLESGSLKFEKEIFTLAEILTFIRPITATHQKNSECEFTELIPDDSVKIEANKQAVEQIIANLLVNAFKFCNKTSVTLEIKREAENLKIVVTDLGIGIAPDLHQKIFESFYQVSLGTKRKFGGIGLGLSIVKKLVMGLNGKISLESTPGQGSRFEVILPVVID
ncbi:MAG TPA: HAMP domain-containing sensor histidine kinase [Candidatus Rifleibacterium sp.]|nr:HAMP domain-containing sensor histidine kinase [Candidatus Rifleibacterium sp.]